MKSNSFLNMLLSIFAILGIFFVIGNRKEGFTSFSSAPFPSSIDTGLLYPDYKMHSNPGLSEYGMEKAYKLYPIYAVGNYAQKTNNKRYWDSPCNGLTTPPEMCGELYKPSNMSQKNNCEIKPPKNEWTCNRVNFYCSKNKANLL